MKKEKGFVQKFTDILIKQGSINSSQAESLKKDFFNRSKDAFDFFLIDEGIVSKEDILKALSKYFQIPAVDVVGIFFDHDLLKNFEKVFLTENNFIPFGLDGDILTVVADNPTDPDLASKIEEKTDYVVQFRVGLAQDILDSIREYYDEPPETYMHDTTDEDEPEDLEVEEGLNVDEYIEEEGL